LKGLIVHGRAFDANDKQLYEECKKHGIKIRATCITNLSASISPQGFKIWFGDRNLTKINFCFLRSFGWGSYEQIARRIAVMAQLELDGTLIINSTRSLENTQNKYFSLCKLAKEGLPIPETFVTETSSWAYRACQKFKKSIYKPIIGSLGFGSMKFDNHDIAFNAFRKLESLGQPLYVQEFLEKPGRDIRAFVLDGEVIASIFRIATSNSWKTNVAQGGKAKALKLSSELEEIALKATETLDLIYAGVDIAETKNGPIILEVNGAPSWQGLQKATGINVAEHLVQYILDNVKD
jgi:ribosomal protein S6--L-glutamate ligase